VTTGYSATAKTIGMTVVAALAAQVACMVAPRFTADCRANQFGASTGSRFELNLPPSGYFNRQRSPHRHSSVSL